MSYNQPTIGQRKRGVTKTYSHAAPYIREQILSAAGLKLAARTQRDRREYAGQMFGLVQALRILLRSDDYPDSPSGCPEFHGDPRALAEVERYLGGPAEMREMGFVNESGAA